MSKRLAIVRLPTVVLPTSPVSLRVLPSARACPDVPLSISSALVAKCETDGGGLLATVPSAEPSLGVRLQLVGRTDALAHFVVADRVRLPALAERDLVAGAPVEHELLADRAELETHPEQIERRAEEAVLARQLVDQEVRSGKLALDLGFDELGVEHADFCRHPSWAASKVLPRDASALSFWIPARLPLTTQLKARFLHAFSSLWRLQTAVDAIRFLCADPVHDLSLIHI